MLVLLTILLLLEMVLSTRPKHGYDYSGQHYTWGHLVEYNSLGYRERELPSTRLDDGYRVMVLGDSLTFGEGLAIENRYTDIAQAIVSKQPGKTAQIYNFGLNGLSTIDQYEILVKHFEQTDPDLIVVGFSLNDTQTNVQRYSSELKNFRTSIVGKGVFIVPAVLRKLGFREISRLAIGAIFGALEKTGTIPVWWEALDRTYEKNSSEWIGFSTALQQINDFTVEHSLPAPVMLILNQGTSTTEPSSYGNLGVDPLLEKYFQWYDQVAHEAEAAGFIVHDYAVEFAEKFETVVLAVNKYDSHPNRAMNEVYAEKLVGVILDSER